MYMYKAAREGRGWLGVLGGKFTTVHIKVSLNTFQHSGIQPSYFQGAWEAKSQRK